MKEKMHPELHDAGGQVLDQGDLHRGGSSRDRSGHHRSLADSFQRTGRVIGPSFFIGAEGRDLARST